MIFKLIFVAATLLVAFSEAQAPWDDGDPISEIDSETPSPEQPCNTTVCNTPCEGAASPPICPPDMPECPSGCACFMDCTTDTLTCFMTKHCTIRRRIFTKRRHARAATQDVGLSLSTVAQASPASTVVQTKKQSAEHNLSFTDAHGIREKHDSLVPIQLPIQLPTHNISGRAKKVLSTSSASQTASSTEEARSTQAINQIVGNDIASTVVQSLGRVERQLSESTLTATTGEASTIEYATFRVQQDAITLVKPVSIDYKRLEKEAEKAAEAKVKKAAEKSAEKAVEAQKGKKKTALIKSANGGRVVAEVNTACLVLFACIYGCLGSVLPGNP